ncbi:MAG: hypothetical protein KVP17_004623 [Porospora cf. gigantea B]|uniref:uncharacterized protein n=1 Tax=Porospora cf. gigantea B TaxID=2853592 RepID=UPI0035718358|nr:MAG: hypothetical protein KVP17_004623 [Porospora cf. gigantea B]
MIRECLLSERGGLTFNVKVMAANEPTPFSWSLLDALKRAETAYKSPEELKRDVDQWIARFESNAEDQPEADAEGWVKVVDKRTGKHKAVGNRDMWGAFGATMTADVKKKKRARPASYDDFYAFQVKRRKAATINKLADDLES